jgi:hypothetical protein
VSQPKNQEKKELALESTSLWTLTGSDLWNKKSQTSLDTAGSLYFFVEQVFMKDF